jgi:hypothetical protein
MKVWKWLMQIPVFQTAIKRIWFSSRLLQTAIKRICFSSCFSFRSFTFTIIFIFHWIVIYTELSWLVGIGPLPSEILEILLENHIRFMAVCNNLLEKHIRFMAVCNNLLEKHIRFMAVCNNLLEKHIRFMAVCNNLLEKHMRFKES